jgi:hypothetical protein
MATSLANQSKADLAALVEHAERALDTVFAPAARALGEAAREGGSRPMTQEDRRAILRSAETILDALYGRQRRSPSPVRSIIVADAVAAWRAPQAREAARVATVLIDRDETALLAAMMRGEGDGTT